MSQFILDALKEVLSSPLILMLVGTLLGSLVANKAHEKKLKSASDSERRKHLLSILAKILAHQARLMDRLYEVYKLLERQDELEKQKDHAAKGLEKLEYEQMLVNKTGELINPINDALHELLAELKILTDIPNNLYHQVGFRCGTSNLTRHVIDTAKDNRIKESVEQYTTELEMSKLYLNTFQSIRRDWMDSLQVAIHAVLKHTEE